MSPFLAEIVGTTLLLLLISGVVANVVLSKTKGHGAGWIVITTGCALAVFVGVSVSARFSGAHLNPAVTIGLAAAGEFSWALVPSYILAQMIGAALGSSLILPFYYSHFAETTDPNLKLAVFSTGPEIRSPVQNFIGEAIGTMVLVLAVLMMAKPNVGLGAVDAMPVALVVFAIGLSLGGTTGFGINPARDLAPRIMHQLLPVPGKGSSNWSYAWIPVVGPIAGALLAVVIYRFCGQAAGFAP